MPMPMAIDCVVLLRIQRRGGSCNSSLATPDGGREKGRVSVIDRGIADIEEVWMTAIT